VTTCLFALLSVVYWFARAGHKNPTVTRLDIGSWNSYLPRIWGEGKKEHWNIPRPFLKSLFTG